MIHHLKCNVPLNETWRQWINDQLHQQAEELEELDKASVQNARLKVPNFIDRLRQMMALKLRHEAVSYTLDDDQHIALSHYLHELFDQHQVKMQELAENCLNAFNRIHRELIDRSLQIVDNEGNKDDAKVKLLSQTLNEFQQLSAAVPVLVEVDKVTEAYSSIANERERAEVMLEDYKILPAYLKWDLGFDFWSNLTSPQEERFRELENQLNEAIDEDRLHQSTRQIAEAITIYLAYETPAVIKFMRSYCYCIWLYTLTDINAHFMRLTDKGEFKFGNPIKSNRTSSLNYTADEITGGEYKKAMKEIKEYRESMMDGDMPNPDPDRMLWAIIHQRHHLHDVADEYWWVMLMTIVGMYHIDEYKLDGVVGGCFMGDRITNDASSPRFIVVSAQDTHPAFTLISSFEDTESLTLSIDVLKAAITTFELDKVVDYLRDTLKIDIEPEGEWTIEKNKGLEAFLTDFDAMRKRGAWNKYKKWRK